ncbi:transglutaminase domain-containing protein [Mycoplasmopsis fermentans]|nr:transglutaminase domain-containing protein [Mycoplasmopsis fermentans]ADN69410.1 conserved hypothetical membrane spanning protein [Mycoplasmopsis fermentans JER]ADV35038.1 Hypothetical Protein MfeM64YM_1043 [Mycoplasmopsis fermentans M64]VEU60025.1 Uncharacterised protein [Mycoplasmopsis fermentans]VEU66966.1 Uncharacterised protein [Mesomycoplasma conjunctivae]
MKKKILMSFGPIICLLLMSSFSSWSCNNSAEPQKPSNDDDNWEDYKQPSLSVPNFVPEGEWEDDGSIYKYYLKPNTAQEIEINSKEKELSLLKIKKFVSDIEITNFEASSDPEVNKIIKDAWAIKQELLQLNNDVYDKFGLHENRYKKYLVAYKNFINLYIDNENSRAYIFDLLAPKHNNFCSWISFYLDKYKRGAFDRIVNNKDLFYKNYDLFRNFIDRNKKDLELVFDLKDAKQININNLKMYTENINSVLNKQLNVEHFRKSLVKNGVNVAPLIKYYYGTDKYNSLRNLVYDLTGGSNYFNDFCFKGNHYKNSTSVTFYQPENNVINIKINRLAYRTENAQEEIDINKYFEKIIYSIISKQMNDEQKIRAIHNWIILNNDYLRDDEMVYCDKQWAQTCRSPYAYIGNWRIVCDAYARTFQRFMTLLDIPSWYITGPVKTYVDGKLKDDEGHAWNLVLLNGKEYFVDCTWDDPSYNEYKEKYNVNSKEISPINNNYLLKEWKDIKYETYINKNNKKIEITRELYDSYHDLYELRTNLGLPYFKANEYV